MAITTIAVTHRLGVVYLWDFIPPFVLAGIAVGFFVRRWIVLALPLALWVIPGVAWGVVPAILHLTRRQLHKSALRL